jgi:transcriptional regulator of arginine metabolism
VNKAFRQGQILNVIRARSVHTQEDLAQALRQLGIPATQVTLSRDMKELRLAKTPDGYRQLEPQPTGPTLATLVAEFLLDIRQAQNLLVLRTAPGHANSLAVALDHENWPEIVGTIAGDDTILVVLPDVATADMIRERLLSRIAGNE